MIKVENLTKTFVRNQNNFDAVDDVTLNIQQGKFAALIGHSGSGKTTLFNMIAGLIRPTSGKIFLQGTELTKMSEKEKIAFRNESMGYVLQGQSLLGNFNILDNVCMPAYLCSNSKIFKERAKGLLESIGLLELANEYPANLSGGEIKRVAIVRAMINQPKVILADEPTSNLDPDNSHKVMKMLSEISKSGTTVIVSTHEMEYISYTDMVFKMQKGNLIKETLEEYGSYQ